MLEDCSVTEQDLGFSIDYTGAMFLPACIEEMVESENYSDARFSENDFCSTETIVSKKATLAYVNKESQEKYELEEMQNKGFVNLLQNKLRKDASTDAVGSKICTTYPSSSASSTSESPTGTLTPLEQQNELWQAIGSLDIFLLDKDIIEACEKSNEDQCSNNEDLLGTPAVSLVEFLQQYKELADWLKLVQETVHRDVTCLSEKYLHLNYHEEMLERSPRLQFLNDYSNQLLMCCPKVSGEVIGRMVSLNAQWEDLEQTFSASCHLCNPEAMQKDLQKDMTTLRQWLTAVEAALLPLAINTDWTPAELEMRLTEHQILQEDIESHNRIVSAVLQLSQQLDDNAYGFSKEGVSSSFHPVALNLQRRWHGIWLQSLEWQCRLEECVSRKGSCHKDGLDFCTRLLPVVNESSLSNSSSSTNIQDLLEIDDEDFLFITHSDNYTNSVRLPAECQHEDLRQIIIDSQESPASLCCCDFATFEIQTTSDIDDLSVSVKCGDSPSTTDTQRESENPSESFNLLAHGRYFSEEKLYNFSTVRNRIQSFSTSTLQEHAFDSVESFNNIRYSCLSTLNAFPKSPSTKDNDHSCLTSSKRLFDLSSGDSANFSESDSKMEDLPILNGPVGEPEDLGGVLATSSEGEEEPFTLEGKDIGYSSDSLSNDEEDVLHHQIGIECKFPGKCEVASDGPLGEKVTLPSVATRPEYYFMTMVDFDSTDKTDNGDTTDSGAEKMKKYRGQYRLKSARDVPRLEVQCFNLPRSSADNEGATDSGSEKIDKYTNQYTVNAGKDLSKLEGQHLPRPKSSFNQAVGVFDGTRSKQKDQHLHALDGSWSVYDLATTSPSDRGFHKETKFLSRNTNDYSLERECVDPQNEFPLGNECIGSTYEWSHSDKVVESEEKNSIKYLIDHAEDLVKLPSPRKQHPKSPSKQTQTESFSTVESSCDASAEDNSEFESHLKNDLVKEELSTTTDDADETLFNSVIHIGSVEESTKDEDLDHTIISPYSPVIIDSPHLRKQTGRRRHQKGDSRPWSVAGLDNLFNKFPNEAHNIGAVSESAINHLNFQTVIDLPSWLRTSSQSMPPYNDGHPWRTHRVSTSCDQISSPLEHSALHKLQPSRTKTTSTSYEERTMNSHGSLATQTQSVLDIPFPYANIPSQTSTNKTSSRHSLCKTSHQKLVTRHSTERHSTERHSWASDVPNSAEFEPGANNSEEYHNPPLELAASDGDDIHNVSGSLSESSTWDNYQMLYPTASEDPGEELMTWEPADDLEFDDDFLLKHQKESVVKNEIISIHKHAELNVSQQNLLAEDSDSELEDFHHILDQSELALKKAEQSLAKMRNHPGSPRHMNSIKYDEIIKMYETSMGCLKSICHHLKSENVPENDVKRVQALMCQWEELHNLATDYQTHAKLLSDVGAFIVEAQTHIQEVDNCVLFNGLTTAEELKKVITLLEERRTTLKKQEQQLNVAYHQLMEFSALHPIKHAERYSQELPNAQKDITAAITRVSYHVQQQTEWLEYLERQHTLNGSITTDREKLHKLLCQQEYGMPVNKNDVLKELEILRNNLSLYESELSLLKSMWFQLTKNSDPSAQGLLASIGDLRNQLLVMSQRCCQIDLYFENDDDDDIRVDQLSDLGKLAMYSTALHEATIRPENKLSRSSSLDNLLVASSANRKRTRSYATWLCSLPAQVVALMLVTGLIWALDPDILDRLTNLTLRISPELNYINGPPAI